MSPSKSAPPEVEPFGLTSPVLALPYPVGTDPADVPADFLRLVNRLEALYGVSSGYATLDSGGHIPSAQLPATVSGLGTLIADVTTTNQASVDFTSIPATYKHLRLLFRARSFAAVTCTPYIGINGDATGANYAYLPDIRTNASTIGGSALGVPILYGNAVTHGLPFATQGFAYCEMTIPFYTETWNKMAQWRHFQLNRSGSTDYGRNEPAVYWANTAAINRLTLSGSGANFGDGHFTLWGLS